MSLSINGKEQERIMYIKLKGNITLAKRGWNGVPYVIVMSSGNTAIIEYTIGNATIYRHERGLECDHAFHIPGIEFAKLLRLSEKRYTLPSFNYKDGLLINTFGNIKAKPIMVESILDAKAITSYERIGTWYARYTYKTYHPFIGTGRYSYVRFKRGYTLMASPTFFHLYEGNGLFKSERLENQDGRIALYKDVLLHVPQGQYTIYANRDKAYFVGPKGNVIIIAKKIERDDFNIKIPDRSKFSYLELDKTLLKAQKSIIKSLHVYMTVYFTDYNVIFKTDAAGTVNPSKYTIPISQRKGVFPRKIKMLAYMIGIFGPGYFYFNTDRDPGIIIKKDPWNGQIIGTILIKEDSDNDNNQN